MLKFNVLMVCRALMILLETRVPRQHMKLLFLHQTNGERLFMPNDVFYFYFYFFYELRICFFGGDLLISM